MKEGKKRNVGNGWQLIELIDNEKPPKELTLRLRKKDDPKNVIDIITLESLNENDVRSFVPFNPISELLKKSNFDVLEAILNYEKNAKSFDQRVLFVLVSIFDRILRLSNESDLSNYAKRIIKEKKKVHELISYIKENLEGDMSFPYSNHVSVYSINNNMYANLYIIRLLINPSIEWPYEYTPDEFLFPLLFETELNKVLKIHCDKTLELPPNIRHSPVSRLEIHFYKHSYEKRHMHCIFPENFAEMKNLKELYISSSDLVVFPNKLPNSLKTIEFVGCVMHNSPINAESLESITFHRVNVDDGSNPLAVIGNCPNLKEVEIGYSALNRIPMNFSSLKNLQKIEIIDCDCKDFADEIPPIPSLKVFKSVNSIGYIPSTISNLPSLEYLGIGTAKYDPPPKSDIRTPIIPQSICRLENLKVFKASCMGIKNIDNLFYLTNLEEIAVDRNPIRQMPDRFDLLPKLRVLNLYSTEVERIPTSLYHHKNIEDLNLCGIENLSAIPRDILHMTSLRVLDISYNPLRYVPQELFFKKGLKITTGHLPHFIKTSCRKIEDRKYEKMLETLGNLVDANIEAIGSFSISIIDLNKIPFKDIGADKIPKDIDITIYVNAPPSTFAVQCLEALFSRARSVKLVIKTDSEIAIADVSRVLNREIESVYLSIQEPISSATLRILFDNIICKNLKIYYSYPYQNEREEALIDLSHTTAKHVDARIGSRYKIICPSMLKSLKAIRIVTYTKEFGSNKNEICAPSQCEIEVKQWISHRYYDGKWETRIVRCD